MKAFDIITEADARVLEIGTTVELAKGGVVTPLAKDTLAARRITVVPAGTSDPTLPADLAPTADVRRVTIGSDHSGVALKRMLINHLRGRGLAVLDESSAKEAHIKARRAFKMLTHSCIFVLLVTGLYNTMPFMKGCLLYTSDAADE